MDNSQKFHNGDLVHIVANPGSSMAHFESDVDAIVIGSYADQYGGSNHDSYTVRIKNGGEVSWYDERQLELIEPNRSDLLQRWEEEATRRFTEESSLDWIFSHAEKVLAQPSSANVIGLAASLGFTENDLWGRHGEGYTFWRNSQLVLALAKPFLESCDQPGFEAIKRRT